MSDSKQQIILFFDGVCGLCNRWVDFVLKKDKNQLFRFTPLQGEKAKEVLPEKYLKDLSTLILKIDDQIYIQSDAVLMICQKLGGIWKIFSYFRWIPRFIRDFCYRLIAKNRYRFFGKKEICRIPTPEERKYFYD